MKRKQWLRRGYAAETIRCATQAAEYYCIIHDPAGRTADGFGESEEAAFERSHTAYLKQRSRAKHSSGHADRFAALLALNEAAQ
jgi:hypothetical protein